jgi:prevent-host-death family protein
VKCYIHGAQGELNDVIDRSSEDGPQTIVRDGNEVAVVMSISDYHKLTDVHAVNGDQEFNDDTPDLRDFLLSRSGPFSDEFAIIMEHIVREHAEDRFRDVELRGF